MYLNKRKFILVNSGYAFAYRRYSKKFVPDEDYAKLNKLGMWSMEFDYPWDWRKKKLIFNLFLNFSLVFLQRKKQLILRLNTLILRKYRFLKVYRW